MAISGKIEPSQSAPSLNSKSMATLGQFENPRTVGHVDMGKIQRDYLNLGKIHVYWDVSKIYL